MMFLHSSRFARPLVCAVVLVASGVGIGAASASDPPTPAARDIAKTDVPATLGYYRMPAMRGDIIVFAAEGDLWRTGLSGGQAMRLTTHAGEEKDPSISPDGQTLAFTATYEGPREVYTMPLAGGLPTRRTWDAGRVGVTSWTPDGKLLYATDAGSTLPSIRTWRQDIATDVRDAVPLAQCSDAAFVDATNLVFTRLQFQGSHTDRYQGGTAQQLWRFAMPATGARGDEAKPLTADYAGTSRRPLLHRATGGDRIVFTTDRSGRMNLWSMKPDGSDLKQHTKHTDFDIGGSAIDGNRVVYQLGPDLRLFDLGTGEDRLLDIRLASDLDQTREKWVKDPAASASSVHLSPNGDRVVLTTRGHVFVAPAKQGRTVEVDRRPGIRYREATFMPDGSTLVAISDESGELELVILPANGVGAPQRKTSDATTLRWRAVPSLDGKRIAHIDKLQRLWVFDVEKNASTLVEENLIDQIDDLTWSYDSRWLAYVAPAANANRQIRLWPAEGGSILNATTDRYDSYKPAWSPDGKFLYFLSDRVFKSIVGSPWGPRQPEPYFDKTGNIYQLALKSGTRSPFQPNDEVMAAQKLAEKAAEKNSEEKKKEAAKAPESKPDAKPADKPADKPTDKPAAKVEIDVDGLATRIEQVPTPVTNFGRAALLVTEKAIFWLAFDPLALADDETPGKGTLWAVPITNESPEPKTVLANVSGVELSADRLKMLVRRDAKCFIIDAAPAPATLEKPDAAVDFAGISLAVAPIDEWRQMTIDAWRMLRDYFYDRNMHGVQWRAVLDKYLPWVERVRSREELSDLLSEMTGELSALHHFVNGGDLRRGNDRIMTATLGAELIRDDAAGGWRVVSIPVSDSDEVGVGVRSPLDEPTVNGKVGDVIRAIDGVSTLSVQSPSVLLRSKAGRQTLLSVLSKGAEQPHDVIVRPLSAEQDAELRYRSWELTRRAAVDEMSNGDFGYVHLRAMGGDDFTAFARDYYPVFNRKGLIVDVRSNRGGNIDSWILSRLMRKAWMFWNQPAGRGPTWNMQFAFLGPIVVLCNESTASDGEAFSEGFKRLGLGQVIGTRTWGGEIWLSSSNRMVDGGIASAGENGVFDAKGVWLIEGHGVEPDIVVDNLPHATFLGDDAQLKAAIEHLKARNKEQSGIVPPVPPRPIKVPVAPIKP